MVTLILEEADISYHKPPLSKSFMQTADAPLQDCGRLVILTIRPTFRATSVCDYGIFSNTDSSAYRTSG